MPESRKVNVRIGDWEEATLKYIKVYLASFLEKDPKKITDSEAINFAIRCTGKAIAPDETIQRTK